MVRRLLWWWGVGVVGGTALRLAFAAATTATIAAATTITLASAAIRTFPRRLSVTGTELVDGGERTWQDFLNLHQILGGVVGVRESRPALIILMQKGARHCRSSRRTAEHVAPTRRRRFERLLHHGRSQILPIDSFGRSIGEEFDLCPKGGEPTNGITPRTPKAVGDTIDENHELSRAWLVPLRLKRGSKRWNRRRLPHLWRASQFECDASPLTLESNNEVVVVVDGVKAPASDCGHVGLVKLEAFVVATHIAAIIGDHSHRKEVSKLESGSRQSLKQL